MAETIGTILFGALIIGIVIYGLIELAKVLINIAVGASYLAGRSLGTLLAAFFIGLRGD